jgi:Uma2 family endonuclease
MQLLELASRDTEQRIVLQSIPWEKYEALLFLFGDDYPGLRLNYLEGTLEIWMPGRTHENIKKMLARLLETFAEEQNLDLNGYGSTTFRLRAKERGLEPDECYVLGELGEVPDLALEVVITHGVLDRLDIYRGLGVREVWVWEKQQLNFYILLNQDQPYFLQSRSQLLPELDPNLLLQFLDPTNQTQSVKAYRIALKSASQEATP